MKNYRLLAAVSTMMLCSGAIAQSNVVLYGQLDAGVGRSYQTDGTGVLSNYEGVSRWGIRGSEDLGNGLAANFNFESGAINIGDGAIGGNGGMNRQAWVGLSGNFGSFMVGRTTTAQSRLMGRFDLNGEASGSSAPTYVGLSTGGSFGGSRQSSQIQYATPNIGGFQGRVSYVPKDDRQRQAPANKAFIQGGGLFQTGGLSLAAVVQGKMADDEGPESDNRTGYSVAAGYDFDFMRLSSFYTRRETAISGEGFGLGAAVPFGPYTIGLQAAHLHKSSDPEIRHATAYELFSEFRLSPRSNLYATYGRLDQDARLIHGPRADGQRTEVVNKSTWAIGLLHNF